MRIPTQRRTGNGHIYSRHFMDDDTAEAVLRAGVDGAPLAEPRQIRFTAGHRRRFWSGNCVAIGLSAASSSRSNRPRSISFRRGSAASSRSSRPRICPTSCGRNTIGTWMSSSTGARLHRAALCGDGARRHAVLAILPDHGSARHAPPQDRAVPRNRRVFRYNDELFARPSWVAVMLGQRIMPRRYDPVIATLPVGDVAHSLRSMAHAMADAVQRLPTHADYLAHYCAAGAERWTRWRSAASSWSAAAPPAGWRPRRCPIC